MNIPSLSAFEEQVMKYKTMEEQVKELDSSRVIGWLKVVNLDLISATNCLDCCFGSVYTSKQACNSTLPGLLIKV